MKRAYIPLIILLFTQLPAAWSQSLQKCNDGNVFWLIPVSTNQGYAVKLRGDIDLSAQPDILNIDDKALQYIMLAKAPLY